MVNRIKQWLQTLSFRTGVIVLLCCIPFYILSFAQMLLPISAAAKGVLWTVLFGMAKTCQYGGLTILGVEGYQRLKSWFKREERLNLNATAKYPIAMGIPPRKLCKIVLLRDWLLSSSIIAPLSGASRYRACNH